MNSTQEPQPRLGPAWLRQQNEGGKDPDTNKFSVLNDVDDILEKPTDAGNVGMSRLQKRISTGRSLADLAASRGSDRPRRLGDLVPDRDESRPLRATVSRATSVGHHPNFDPVADKAVIRYTREKLLALRASVSEHEVPESLQHLIGTPILSESLQEPVCFDDFDPDEIWASAGQSAKYSQIDTPRGTRVMKSRGSNLEDRKNGGDKWQRGVALPPAESNREASNRSSDDLWDDPYTLPASDFEQFGGSLDEAPKPSSAGAFDLSDMAAATQKFEEELRSDPLVDINGDDRDDSHIRITSSGAAIQSGSGDNVNVFEDFEELEPTEVSSDDSNHQVTVAENEENASSRLMNMIGVGQETETETETINAWGIPTSEPKTETASFGGLGVDPWGSGSSVLFGKSEDLGLQSRIDSSVNQQKLMEEQQEREKEIARKRKESKAREAEMIAKEQQKARELRQRQEQMRQNQQQMVQIEMILVERISTVLEKSWGRSELQNVLQILHHDDPRVIPLLGNTDALRALLVRHPKRVGLSKDPTFGTEIATLLMTNAQYQQHQQLEQQQREHQKRLEEQQATAKARAEAEAAARLEAQAKQLQQMRTSVTSAPWFYADPQGNIQGPFGSNEMRQWLKAGYFKGDLPISQNPSDQFTRLQHLFPDLDKAFLPFSPYVDPNDVSPTEVVHFPKEEIPKAEPAQSILSQNSGEETPSEQVAQADLTPNQGSSNDVHKNSSAQLKQLLGVGGVTGSKIESVSTRITEEQQMIVEEIAVEESPESESVVEPEPIPVPAPAPAPVPSAWGGASSATVKTAPTKSMSEIQAEEARAAAKKAKEQKKPKQNGTGGGWANIAASGGTAAWTGGVAKRNIPAAAPIATPQPQATKPSATFAAKATSTKTLKAKQQALVASKKQTMTKEKIGIKEESNNFGVSGRMSGTMEAWCKQELKRLTGSDDLTLVLFCMTLKDSNEIKQYLTAYLGSSSSVDQFSKDFIAMKNGGNPDSEWESTESDF